MTKIIRLNDLQISILKNGLTAVIKDVENEIGANVQVESPESERLIWLGICHTEIQKILKKLDD